jgi:hypothetical protein
VDAADLPVAPVAEEAPGDPAEVFRLLSVPAAAT